jgi:hypothetical protein
LQDSENSIEKLDEIVKRATLNKFIPIRDLGSIMVEGKGYSDIFPNLWKFYQCDIDYVIDDQNGRGVWIPPRKTKKVKLKLDTLQDRRGAWIRLLHRWTGILLDDEEGDYPEHFTEQAENWRRENLEPIKYLNVYNHSAINDPIPKDLRFRLSSDLGSSWR